MGWLELLRNTLDSILRSTMGMRPRVLIRRAPQQPPHSSSQRVTTPRPLLDYQVTSEPSDVRQIYERIRAQLSTLAEELSQQARSGFGGRTIFREHGTTMDKRRFSYFKPFNDYGWLVEETAAGVRISRAEKIESDQVFLRSSEEPWEVIVLQKDPASNSNIRIDSKRFGRSLLSFSVYQDRLTQAFRTALIGHHDS